MAEFDLDVDIPIEIPPQNEIFDKPKLVPYPKTKIKTKHYGHNIDLLIEQIDKYEGEELYQYVEQILNQMKRLYINWNKDLVADDIIKKEFVRLSGKKFDFIEEIELAEVKIIKHNKNHKKKQHQKRR